VLGTLIAAAEPSKVPFYLVGGVLVVWALALAGSGLTRPSFPHNDRGVRGIILLSLLLVVATLATAIATSR
jgi:hypothetical protein